MSNAPTDIPTGDEADLARQVDQMLSEADLAATTAAPQAVATSNPPSQPDRPAPSSADRSAHAGRTAVAVPIAPAPAAPAGEPPATDDAESLEAQVNALLEEASRAAAAALEAYEPPATPPPPGAPPAPHSASPATNTMAARAPRTGPAQGGAVRPPTMEQLDAELARSAEESQDDPLEGEFLAPADTPPAVEAAPAAIVTAPPPAPAGAPGTPGSPGTPAAPAATGASAPSAPAPAPPAAAPAAPPPPGAPAPVAPRKGAASALLAIGVLANWPLLGLSPRWRETVKWFTLNTLFIAACLWVFLLLRPGGGSAGHAETPPSGAETAHESGAGGAQHGVSESDHAPAKAQPKHEAKPKPSAGRGGGH